MNGQAYGPRVDGALLAIRLALGAAFVAHGFGKVQHPFTWAQHTLPGTPAWLQAISAGAEFIGGIAMILGLLSPLFAFLIACNMIVAIFLVAIPHGAVYVTNGGSKEAFELPLAYLVMAFAVLLAGAGSYSLDALLRGRSGKAPMPRRGRR